MVPLFRMFGTPRFRVFVKPNNRSRSEPEQCNARLHTLFIDDSFYYYSPPNQMAQASGSCSAGAEIQSQLGHNCPHESVSWFSQSLKAECVDDVLTKSPPLPSTTISIDFPPVVRHFMSYISHQTHYRQKSLRYSSNVGLCSNLVSSLSNHSLYLSHLLQGLPACLPHFLRFNRPVSGAQHKLRALHYSPVSSLFSKDNRIH